MGLSHYTGEFVCSCVLVGTSTILYKYVPIQEDYTVIEKKVFLYHMLFILICIILSCFYLGCILLRLN